MSGWVAGAVVVAGVAGAEISSQAAKSAAQTQANAATSASQLQYQQFEESQQNLAPWRAAGASALNTLSQGTQPGGQFNKPFTMADFQQSPGYNFQQQQGQAAINASAAAGGKSFSPATAQALSTFNQGLAGTSYQQALSNYMNQENMALGEQQSLAGVGLSATMQQNQLGANMANQVGSNMIGAGNAQAAGQVGSANAWSNALSQGGQSYLNANYMNQILGNQGPTGYASNIASGGQAGGAGFNAPGAPGSTATLGSSLDFAG